MKRKDDGPLSLAPALCATANVADRQPSSSRTSHTTDGSAPLGTRTRSACSVAAPCAPSIALPIAGSLRGRPLQPPSVRKARRHAACNVASG